MAGLVSRAPAAHRRAPDPLSIRADMWMSLESDQLAVYEQGEAKDEAASMERSESLFRRAAATLGRRPPRIEPETPGGGELAGVGSDASRLVAYVEARINEWRAGAGFSRLRLRVLAPPAALLEATGETAQASLQGPVGCDDTPATEPAWDADAAAGSGRDGLSPRSAQVLGSARSGAGSVDARGSVDGDRSVATASPAPLTQAPRPTSASAASPALRGFRSRRDHLLAAFTDACNTPTFLAACLSPFVVAVAVVASALDEGPAFDFRFVSRSPAKRATPSSWTARALRRLRQGSPFSFRSPRDRSPPGPTTSAVAGLAPSPLPDLAPPDPRDGDVPAATSLSRPPGAASGRRSTDARPATEVLWATVPHHRAEAVPLPAADRPLVVVLLPRLAAPSSEGARPSLRDILSLDVARGDPGARELVLLNVNVQRLLSDVVSQRTGAHVSCDAIVVRIAAPDVTPGATYTVAAHVSLTASGVQLDASHELTFTTRPLLRWEVRRPSRPLQDAAAASSAAAMYCHPAVVAALVWPGDTVHVPVGCECPPTAAELSVPLTIDAARCPRTGESLLRAALRRAFLQLGPPAPCSGAGEACSDDRGVGPSVLHPALPAPSTPRRGLSREHEEDPDNRAAQPQGGMPPGPPSTPFMRGHLRTLSFTRLSHPDQGQAAASAFAPLSVRGRDSKGSRTFFFTESADLPPSMSHCLRHCLCTYTVGPTCCGDGPILEVPSSDLHIQRDLCDHPSTMLVIVASARAMQLPKHLALALRIALHDVADEDDAKASGSPEGMDVQLDDAAAERDSRGAQAVPWPAGTGGDSPTVQAAALAQARHLDLNCRIAKSYVAVGEAPKVAVTVATQALPAGADRAHAKLVFELGVVQGEGRQLGLPRPTRGVEVSVDAYLVTLAAPRTLGRRGAGADRPPPQHRPVGAERAPGQPSGEHARATGSSKRHSPTANEVAAQERELRSHSRSSSRGPGMGSWSDDESWTRRASTLLPKRAGGKPARGSQRSPSPQPLQRAESTGPVCGAQPPPSSSHAHRAAGPVNARLDATNVRTEPSDVDFALNPPTMLLARCAPPPPPAASTGSRPGQPGGGDRPSSRGSASSASLSPATPPFRGGVPVDLAHAFGSWSSSTVSYTMFALTVHRRDTAKGSARSAGEPRPRGVSVASALSESLASASPRFTARLALHPNAVSPHASPALHAYDHAAGGLQGGDAEAAKLELPSAAAPAGQAGESPGHSSAFAQVQPSARAGSARPEPEALELVVEACNASATAACCEVPPMRVYARRDGRGVLHECIGWGGRPTARGVRLRCTLPPRDEPYWVCPMFPESFRAREGAMVVRVISCNGAKCCAGFVVGLRPHQELLSTQEPPRS